MNLNHDPDKHLLDQIDKRLETGQPSGNALLDELATARPIPRPAAQNALEEQLLARLKSLNQGETSMASTTSYMPIDAPRRNWLPLTLLAALIVVAIAGLMLINGIGKSPKINEIALAGATTTPTPAPTVRIVVAYQNLPRGFGFPNNKVDMQTAAYYAAWPADSVPFDALRDDVNGLEQLQGKKLLTDIYSQQPITLSNLEEVHSSTSELNAINILPSDRVPVELSRAQITNDGIEPVRGDWVNIVALIPLDENTATENLQVTLTPDGKRLIASRVAFGALVAVMGSWPQPQIDATNTPSDPSKITFGVAPDQAGLLTWLAAQGITFKLELVKSADVLVPTPALQPPIPKGRVTVDIPLASLTTKEQSEKLQVGDYVDVIATLLTIDSTLPSAFQGPATLQPGQTPGQRTERIVSEALIVKTDDVITLAVSPDAASLLQQWITAKIPMTLRPVDPATATNGSTNSLTLQLPLDSASRWAADELQVGDKVDVIMGFVTGSSDAVNLAFKYYGALNWLDGLSKEKVFARIYAPNNGKPGRDGIFMHRIIQNAEVIAINTYTDTKSGRMSTLNITVELPTSITLTDLSTINDYVQAGMPYLVIKQ